MRFVSHVRNFMVQVVGERSHATQYGDTIIDREGYHAHFDNNLVNQADILWAEKEFEDEGLLYGRTTMLDEVTLTPLINRLSVFDTDEAALRENWEGRTVTDERGNVHDFKAYVERKLSERAVRHPDFRQVMVEPIAPPWPTYMEFDKGLEELVAKVVEDGYDPRRVLAYERQSGHRPMVEAELEKLVADFERAEALAPEIPA